MPKFKTRTISSAFLCFIFMVAFFVGKPIPAHASGTEPANMDFALKKITASGDSYHFELYWTDPTPIPANLKYEVTVTNNASGPAYSKTIPGPSPVYFYDYPEKYINNLALHCSISNTANCGTYKLTIKVLSGTNEIGTKSIERILKANTTAGTNSANPEKLALGFTKQANGTYIAIATWDDPTWPAGYTASDIKYKIAFTSPGQSNYTIDLSPGANVFSYPSGSNALVCSSTSSTNCGNYKIGIVVMGTKNGATTKIGEASIMKTLNPDGTISTPPANTPPGTPPGTPPITNPTVNPPTTTTDGIPPHCPQPKWWNIGTQLLTAVCEMQYVIINGIADFIKMIVESMLVKSLDL